MGNKKLKDQEKEMEELTTEVDGIISRRDDASYDAMTKSISLKDVYDIDAVTASAIAAEGIDNVTIIKVTDIHLSKLRGLKDLWGKYSKYG